jgi:NAD(P)-dependent dehydrogenase (short-subunit alcohol dehydrogenase family)
VAREKQRIAVVTGASSGIGEAIARALAAQGWRCVLVARREERLLAVAGAIDGEIELCDVSDREAVERAAGAILARHPRIGLLVNNAGIPGRRGFAELDNDPAGIEQVVRVNYLGSVWSLRAFLPGLEAEAAAGRRAHVVNIVSVAGAVAFPPSGPYCAAKHAQLAFSRSVAVELAPRDIAVHTVNPGFVETEGFPQRGVLPRGVDRVVIEPTDIAKHVAGLLRRGPSETVIPSYYRFAIAAQGLAPGLTHRVLRFLVGRGLIRG